MLNVEYKFITKEEFEPIIKQWETTAFGKSNELISEDLYTEEEKQKLALLKTTISMDYRIYLIATVDDKIAGWSRGLQIMPTEFHMCNSAVLPDFRRNGIYTSMLDMILEKVVKDGFQLITSKHHACNNDVLIPKLKKGFMITGFEINPRFGMMATLAYLPNKKIETLYQQRIGFIK